MMRSLEKITGGRKLGSRVHGGRESSYSARPSVSLSDELNDAIESAIVSARECNDDGPRVMVMSHVLRGAFIFTREEAVRRILLAFPDLSDDLVKRAVRHLESRVRLAATQKPNSNARSAWVHTWRDF